MPLTGRVELGAMTPTLRSLVALELGDVVPLLDAIPAPSIPPRVGHWWAKT